MVMNRKLRNIPTARPKSFLSQSIKRDVNYSPTFRTFQGTESAVESGDAYIQRKIREFSNIAFRPADTLQLISLLRPAYQLKKVLDKKDLAEALNRLQELKQLERVPLALKDQLQTIQDYVKTLPSEKKKEVLTDLVNNDNPFPEYEDLDLDDIKRVVAPLYTKDDIMALYSKVPANAPLEEFPDENTLDLEEQIQDLIVQAKLPEPLLPYSTLGMEQEGEEMEEGEVEPESEIAETEMSFNPLSQATSMPVGRQASRAEEQVIRIRGRKPIPYFELENMNITELKQAVAQPLGVSYLNKYKATASPPFDRNSLINAIIKKNELGEVVNPETEEIRIRQQQEAPKTPVGSQLRQPRRTPSPQAQEGEGISDILGFIIDKLTPRSVKEKAFDKFIGKPVNRLLTPSRRY
jgi:hypothetical protein